VNLVGKRIVCYAAMQEALDLLDVQTNGPESAWQRVWRGEDDPEVALTCRRGFSNERHEIRDVLRDAFSNESDGPTIRIMPPSARR
jgi:hypothetical protein